jgi:hypothetical protein
MFYGQIAIILFFLETRALSLLPHFKKNTGKVVRIVAKGLLATNKTGCFAFIIRKKKPNFYLYTGSATGSTCIIKLTKQQRSP